MRELIAFGPGGSGKRVPQRAWTHNGTNLTVTRYQNVNVDLLVRVTAREDF